LLYCSFIAKRGYSLKSLLVWQEKHTGIFIGKGGTFGFLGGGVIGPRCCFFPHRLQEDCSPFHEKYYNKNTCIS